MQPDLPAPVKAYFAAERRGGDDVARCFVETGRVEDEGKVHVGRAAIARWKDESSAAYDFVSEPLTAKAEAGRTVVTGRVTGNFPGSPVELRYVFSLDGDAIAALEIRP